MFFICYKYIICLSFIVLVLKGQQSDYDLGMWLSLGCNVRITDKQQVNTMLRFRQYDNLSEFNSWYYDAGYQFKLLENWRVAIHYAFNPSKTIENYFRNFHQYYIRINYEKSINKYFSINNRIIFQHTTHLFFLNGFAENGYQPFNRTDLRFRPGFSYHINSRLELFLRNEWMFTINMLPIMWKRNRLQMGIEKRWNKKFRTSLYFTLQSILNRRNSNNLHQFIFGLDAVYLFDFRK